MLLLSEHPVPWSKENKIFGFDRMYSNCRFFVILKKVTANEILVDFKLSRIEVLVVMYLYRRVWCRPNLYKEFGISQLMAHTEMAQNLKISIDEIYNALRKLEELGFISTIRSGQYFVRKYFTKENDEKYGQTYDDFEF